MRTVAAALVVIGLCCWPAVARKLDAPDVPIVIGGAVSAAACPGGGDVVGLDLNRAGFPGG